MLYTVSLISLYIVAVPCSASIQNTTGLEYPEDLLAMHLLKHSTKNGRPVKRYSGIVNVSLTFNLMAIVSLDERLQQLTMMGFIVAIWQDERLSWIPQDYGNVTKIALPYSDVWTPSLFIINNAGQTDGSKFITAPKVGVNRMGNVYCAYADTFTIRCPLVLSEFPFDTQVCHMNVTDIFHEPDAMDIQMMNEKLSTDGYEISPQWDLLNSTAFVSKSDDLYKHPVAHFQITIKRKSLMFMINTMSPGLLLSILNLLTFCIPHQSGERITFAITIFLAYSVVLLQLSASIPSTSEEIPTISLYVCCSMVCSFLAVTESVLASNYVHNSANKPVPRWLWYILTALWCRFRCCCSGKCNKSKVHASFSKQDLVRFEAPPDVQEKKTQSSSDAHFDKAGTHSKAPSVITWREFVSFCDKLTFCVIALATVYLLNMMTEIFTVDMFTTVN